MMVAGRWRLSVSIGTRPPPGSVSASLLGIFRTWVCPPVAWKTKICSLWSGPLTMARRSFLPLARSEAGTPTWCTAWSMR